MTGRGINGSTLIGTIGRELREKMERERGGSLREEWRGTSAPIDSTCRAKVAFFFVSHLFLLIEFSFGSAVLLVLYTN